MTGGMGEGSSSSRSCAGACRNCRAARCACRRLAAFPARLTAHSRRGDKSPRCPARLIYCRPSFDASPPRVSRACHADCPSSPSRIRHSRFRAIPLVSRRGAMQFWHGPSQPPHARDHHPARRRQRGGIVGNTDRFRGKRLLSRVSGGKVAEVKPHSRSSSTCSKSRLILFTWASLASISACNI